jgi:Na+-transporting NADH:ubiquinone oxidoreductase subunit NqrA
MNSTLLMGLLLSQALTIVGVIVALYLIFRQSSKPGADQFKETLDQLQAKVEKLEIKSTNNTDLIKTVLHGFDFIVQGCKKAINEIETNLETPISLDIEATGLLEEKKEVTEKTEKKKDEPIEEESPLVAAAS